MRTVINIVEKSLIVVEALIGASAIISGVITGMWHCFLIGAMALALSYAMYSEAKK